MGHLGMSTSSGKNITGLEHIRQSCRDILTTRIGTRLSRRTYGSLLPELIDHPGNGANMLRLKAATVMALARWEPRIEIKTVLTDIDPANPGTYIISMEAILKNGPLAGSNITLDIHLGGVR